MNRAEEPSVPSTGQAGVVVRDGDSTDRTAILDLWVAAWRIAMPEIDFEARRPWLDGHLDALAAAGTALVVVAADGIPVGFITVDHLSGHIDQLAVAPTHQGRGLADLLIAEAKRRSPGGLGLDVNTGNARACRFYARQGFAVVSTGVNPRSGLPTRQMRWAGSPSIG